MHAGYLVLHQRITALWHNFWRSQEVQTRDLIAETDFMKVKHIHFQQLLEIYSNLEAAAKKKKGSTEDQHYDYG